MSWINDVFGANPAIKLLIDPASGRIEDANVAAAAFYGWTVDELTGMSIHDINTATQADVQAEMAAAAASRRTFFRFTHRRSTGELRRVEVFTGPVRVEGRTSLLSIIHDVTDRERALEELSRVEARQRALLSQAPVGIALHRDRRFLWVNPEFARIVGQSAEDLAGADVLSTIAADERAAARESIGRLVDGDPGIAVKRGLLRPEGQIVQTEIRAINFEDQGEPCVLAMVVDVSDREKLEEELRRAQRMDAIGKLAGGVAHDFNNLLAVIVGAVDLIDASFDDRDRVRENVDRIRASAVRATELTRQLLQVARGHDAEKARVDVSAAALGIVSIVRSSLASGVRLEVDVAEGAFVRMPPSEVDQLLLNLLVNARDATSATGRVGVTVRRGSLEPTRRTEVGAVAGDAVCIEVSDTGTGMSPEVLKSAFEPFFTTKEAGRGTGLGLATVYGIVRRAGGHVSLESELGRGTRARVYLPFDGAPPTRSVTEPPPSDIRSRGAASDRVILLVDDHKQVREVVQQILADEGYRVAAAADPHDALTLFEALGGQVGLLLTDVVMPGMRGPELAARLRARAPDLPVLFISAYLDGGSSKTGLVGARLLEKPFSAEALLDRVAEALGSRRPSSTPKTKDS